MQNTFASEFAGGSQSAFTLQAATGAPVGDGTGSGSEDTGARVGDGTATGRGVGLGAGAGSSASPVSSRLAA